MGVRRERGCAQAARCRRRDSASATIPPSTALAALHYRLPLDGVTATVRGGRFLAGDLGARFEMKRRFRSGFQVGAWYSLTNGNDITSPGTPASPTMTRVCSCRSRWVRC